MKKGGLARALKARRDLDAEPEPEPKPATPAAKPATARRRFHTTIYPDSKEFYDDIRIALIREGRDRDFNRLVNDLLKEWLEARTDED